MSSRMKVITVTPKNYAWVTSKIEKFFKHEDFLEWHHWDGGMKKHISCKEKPHCYFPKYFTPGYRLSNVYRGVNCRRRDNSHVNPAYKNFLLIDLNEFEGFGVTLGMKVAFLGNRIMFGEKQSCFEWKHCYSVYQILK